jgi:hypothetical protein
MEIQSLYRSNWGIITINIYSLLYNKPYKLPLKSIKLPALALILNINLFNKDKNSLR